MRTFRVALWRQLSSGESFIPPACPAQSSVQANSIVTTYEPSGAILSYIATRFALDLH